MYFDFLLIYFIEMCNFLLLLNYNFIESILVLLRLKYQSKTFLDFINDNQIKFDNNENKDNEYKNKINELEKYIQELELKIKEKDIIMNEEKIKNDKLNIKIKELENITNKQMNNIKELENELKLLKKNNKFAEGERLISIKFISSAQDIDYSLTTKNTEKFSKIEAKLYEKYPKYKKTNNYFLVSGSKIDKQKTLEQNKIKNNDVITLIEINID